MIDTLVEVIKELDRVLGGVDRHHDIIRQSEHCCQNNYRVCRPTSKPKDLRSIDVLVETRISKSRGQLSTRVFPSPFHPIERVVDAVIMVYGVVRSI